MSDMNGIVKFSDRMLELEEKIINERSRLSSDRMDISFGELINMYKSGELVIRPEYQRLFRWSTAQKTALIESILLGIPVPPIFVAEDRDGIWELVDGLQRVSTIISFYGDLRDDLSKPDNEDTYGSESDDKDPLINTNKWVMEAGSIIEDLDGFSIDTLPKKFAINIKRAACRVEILRGESNTSMKYELFKRLNSGGSKLTAQEIRNAIYRGINPKLNILIEELSKNEQFKNLVSLSEQKIKELYNQELVLRFIAFYKNSDKVNLNAEKFLDKFMEETVQNSKFDYEFFKKLFIAVMQMLQENCTEDVFRNERNSFVPAYYEGITIGLAQSIEKYKDNTALIRERVLELKNDEQFKKYSGSASNSKTRVKKRLERANAIFSR